MAQREPGGSSVVPTIAGAALTAAPVAVLLEVINDNPDSIVVQIAAAVAAGVVCIGGTGAVARGAARRIRMQRDGRESPAASLAVGEPAQTVIAVPVGVQTTRDLTMGGLDQQWSGNVEYVVSPGYPTVSYSTNAHLDVDREGLRSLARTRSNAIELPYGDYAIKVSGTKEIPALRDPLPPIPPDRRHRGLTRVRRSVVAPVLAFLVGFGGVGYGVHQFLPDTSGVGAAVQDVLDSASGTSSSSDDLSAARGNIEDALENAEKNSPGASGRLTEINISPTGSVLVRYVDPDKGKTYQVSNTSSDPYEIGTATSRTPTFAMTASQIPPVSTMYSDSVAQQLDELWFVEIAPPESDVLLPASYQDGEPIIEFVSNSTHPSTDRMQATINGEFAPLFDNADIATGYAFLMASLQTHGIDPASPVFVEFGLSGPAGGPGYSSASAPGNASYAEIGPGTSWGPGEFTLVSGSFATFSADSDSEWDPEDVAALIAMTALSPDMLAAVFNTQVNSTIAEKADIESYAFRANAADSYEGGDPPLLRMSFATMEDSLRVYTLDGQPYSED